MCVPLGNKASFDLVVEKEEVLSRVQIEYVGIYNSQNDKCIAVLRITGGNQSFNKSKKYDNDSFDLLFVHTQREEQFMIPWSKITARNEIFIEHPKYAVYNVT